MRLVGLWELHLRESSPEGKKGEIPEKLERPRVVSWSSTQIAWRLRRRRENESGQARGGFDGVATSHHAQAQVSSSLNHQRGNQSHELRKKRDYKKVGRR